jgi:large subunit ribosomal protein L10e
MYREIKGQAYARREYMGGVPSSRITQFEHGNKADYAVRMTLHVVEQCQIRHIALEAARISANRFLAKKIGQTGYHLKIRVFPHNVLRENKIAPAQCCSPSVLRGQLSLSSQSSSWS